MAKKELENKKDVVFNLNDYKSEIDKYIKERVEVESASQSVKLLKKQLKSKKISSGIKSFIILCLLACIGSGVYYLYNDGYFDEEKTVSKECNCQKTKCDVKTDDDKKTDDKKEDVKSLSELKEEYDYLLDNVIFDANSNYTSDYYKGNFTTEIREYLAYKLIDVEDIIQDEDSNYFESSALETAYQKLFDDEIIFKNFKYNNATYTYLQPKDMFISNAKPNEEKPVTREIIDIKENNNTVVITCVEGYVNDKNKLFNILTNKEVKGYKTSQPLSKYESKLNTVKYTFTDEYLVDISK